MKGREVAEPERIAVDGKTLQLDLYEKRTLFLAEGGSVSTATYRGRPCLLTDESALSGLPGADGPLVHLSVFADEEHRRRYIEQRGWHRMRQRWRGDALRGLISRIEQAEREGLLDRDEYELLAPILSGLELDLPPAPDSLLPDRLRYYEGGMGSSRDVRCLRGTVYCRELGISDVVPAPADNAQVAAFTPSDASWRAFWMGIERIGAWSWETPVGQDVIVDGTRWTFDLEHEGKVLHLEADWGDNGLAHQQLRKLGPLLRRLLNGWQI